jgi:RNA polymerase sigma-70 factor (ECF subfamily)
VVDRAERARVTEALRRLADGDRSAMADVYRGIAGPVRALAARMLGAGADADDVAEETAVEVFSRASDFERDGDAIAWALTIAVWRCRTERKRRSRRRSEPLADCEAELPSPGPDPEELAIAAEARASVEAALGGLDDRDREALDAVLAGAPLSAALRKRKERMLVRLRRMLLGGETT